MTEIAATARHEFTDHFGTRFVWKEQEGSPAPALLLVHTATPDGAIVGHNSDDVYAYGFQLDDFRTFLQTGQRLLAAIEASA